MKRASIHHRRGKYYVETESRTKSGLWIGVGPVHVVDAGEHLALCDNLRSAIEASKTGLPTPPPHEDLTGPLRAAWRAFVKDATCIDAALDDGLVTLTPYRRIDRVGNYVPISEKKQTVRFSSDELAAVVLRVFEDAKMMPNGDNDKVR